MKRLLLAAVLLLSSTVAAQSPDVPGKDSVAVGVNVPAYKSVIDTAAVASPRVAASLIGTMRTTDYTVLKSLQDSRTPAANTLWVWVSNSFVLAPVVPATLAVCGWTNPDTRQGDILLTNACEVGGALLLNAGLTMGKPWLAVRVRGWLTHLTFSACSMWPASPSPRATLPSPLPPPHPSHSSIPGGMSCCLPISGQGLWGSAAFMSVRTIPPTCWLVR